MTLKYCQGPNCHTYTTKDRLRGTKPNKTYQTRRRSSFYYLGGNACDMRCQADWFNKYGDQALNHFGRLNEPKHLTEQNAWTKDYDWRGNADESHRHYYLNTITKEQRPLTKAQYDDTNYTINTGE